MTRLSEVDHFADFCRDHLVQSIDQFDGLPLELEAFQRRFMDDALSYDDRGLPLWRSIVLVVARKNGKTTLLSAYALYRLLTSEGLPEILLAASSDKQAGRLFDACVNFIRKSELLSSLLIVRDYAGEIVRADGKGKILRVASDAKRLHGYSPSLVICDELAQWVTPQLEKAYAALSSGGGARSAPQVFSITTAGEWQHRNDSILGRIIDAAEAADDRTEEPGLLIARLPESRTLAYVYSAPTIDHKNVKALKLANPAPWITTDYLKAQASNPQLSPADVLQLHGCVWSQQDGAWLDLREWKARLSGREVDGPVVLGFDGSYKRDSTALIGCTLDGHLFVVKVWERPVGADEHWRIPRREVNAVVERAMEDYEVVELACDPPGWNPEIDAWEDAYGDVVVRYETNQPKRMAPAVNRFETAVSEQALTHDGNATLTKHIANCLVEDRPSGKVLSKPQGGKKKIDAGVAAVVAYDRASWHATQKPVGAASWVY